MPSELGTSSFIPNLFCEMFTSGVTSHPLRLTLCTGSAPTSASSAVLYILKCRSRHVNQYRLKAFSVNFLGLYTGSCTIITITLVRHVLYIKLSKVDINYSLQKSQVIGQLWRMGQIVDIALWLEPFKRNLKIRQSSIDIVISTRCLQKRLWHTGF